jgi:queuine/archaeosine tRNA-ribosyltransferase
VTLPAEYNVQELQNKISMLTDRCQSAERERKEARRERDETVKQLQEVCDIFTEIDYLLIE